MNPHHTTRGNSSTHVCKISSSSSLKNFSFFIEKDDSLLGEPLNLRIFRTIQTQGIELSYEDKICVERFCEWLENRKEWYVILEREGVSDVRYYRRDFRFFRVYNRFDKEYVKRVIRRFRALLDFAEDRSFVHIVLTVGNQGSISQNIRLLRKNWNRLNSLFKKYLKRFSYVTVLECQKKRGQPHLHILLFTEKYVIDKEKLSEWCKEHGLGKIVFIKRYWAKGGYRKESIHYLGKYLGKQYKMDQWSIRDFIFYACVWCLEAKTYTFSRDLKLPPRRKLKGWSVIVCTYEELIAIIKLNVSIGYWRFEILLDYFTWDLRDKVLWILGRSVSN